MKHQTGQGCWPPKDPTARRRKAIRKNTKQTKVIRRLLQSQNGICFWCESPLKLVDATIEHMIPKSRGGPNRVDNYKAACKRCNNLRGTMRADEFLDLLRLKGIIK